jgi:hypothetical protein
MARKIRSENAAVASISFQRHHSFLYDYCCANLLGASLLLCHQPFQLGLVIFNDLTRHINDYLLDLSGEGGSGFVFLEGINISPYLDNMVG